MSLILFTGNMFSKELAEFRKPDDLATYVPLPSQESRPSRYKALPEDIVIYSTRDEVQQKRDELIREKTDFLFVDLRVMTLDFYREGEVEKSIPVRAKGEEGSFSETPNGYYKIRSKEPKHFSRIHKVWMPWSMHFFGNYFIHGWPYLKNGALVKSITSGGCIRLNTEDAKYIYDFSKIGLPVLVAADSLESNYLSEFTYFRKIMRASPETILSDFSADAALVADLDTGQVLYERRKVEPFSIGEITKLMTAVVVTEVVDDEKYLSVRKSMVESLEDAAGFRPGERFKTKEFLYPLLLSSSNIAARLFEREKWGFLDTMNEKAGAIGLTATRFSDTTGRSSENISSAEDLFKFLRFISLYKRPVFERSGLKSHTLISNLGIVHEFKNLNWEKDDQHFIAGSAGKTVSGLEAMAGVYKVKLSEYGERRIAVIVLNSKDRTRDVETLLNYVEENFIYGNMFAKNKRKPLLIRVGANVFGIFGGF